ncbi:MAG TPA: RNA polymerase sigma factor [Rhizomicrobium sp.]|nr:RNA polymerase sigma factor [Rhizomicrobium sp.]
MATGDNNREGRPFSTAMTAPGLRDWFVREVLPLEAALVQYLQHNWRIRADVEDLLHDIYIKVCEAAARERPQHPRAFVFTTARNTLIDRVRKEQVVPIEAVADLDALNMAADDPGPERTALARDELRRVQAALDRLPPRRRQAVYLKQVEGLTRREIATRMGVGEETVKDYLAEGLFDLAELLFAEPFDLRRRP